MDVHKTKPTKTLLQALAVVSELTHTVLSEDAARVFAQDLSRYPENQVLGALTRCRREIRSNLTPADVIARLDDGRPGPEQAWAMLPRSEAETVVWTDEMSIAYGIALPLLGQSEYVSARMAFLETYRKLCLDARDAGVPVKWTPSPGTDVHSRVTAIKEAVRLGRLGSGHVARLPLQDDPAPAILKAIESKG